MPALPVATVATDERSHARTETEIPAGLRDNRGRKRPIILRNISVNGFMAEGEVPLVPGVAVTLVLANGNSHPARLVWKRAGHCGAAFLEPLTAEQLAAIS